jgi:hypothetical protein
MLVDLSLPTLSDRGFFGPLNIWWLNRKHQAAILATFDLRVEELRKTSLLPNIQDDAINALLSITQVT